MLRLEMLGRLALTKETGLLPAPKRRLALLALLDRAGPRGMPRDKILGYLWPESSQENARHSLEQLLYATRRAYGESVVTGTGELMLNDAAVKSDVREMEAALAAGNLEEAVTLYQGAFLDGFFLSNAPELERWIDTERQRLEGLHSSALERLAADASSSGDLQRAIQWRRRRVSLDPLSSRAAVALMHAFAEAGDTGAALAQAQVHQELLRKELDCEPDPEVATFAEALRAGKGPAPRPRPPLNRKDEDPPQRTPPASAGSEFRSVAPYHRSWTRVGIAGASLIAAVLLVAFVVQQRDAPRSVREDGPSVLGTEPSIAVLAFETASSDSSVEYYGYGLTDALIDRLTSSAALRVIQGPSVYLLRGHRSDTRAIAESLGVSNLLASAVLMEDTMVRVSVKLIDGSNGSVRWSRIFRAAWSNRFALQDSIEHAVPRDLAQQLGATGPRVRRTRFPASERAYELYLKGRHQWNTPAALTVGIRAAISYFNGALAEDSTYADAHAGKAASYVLLGTGNFSDFSHRAAADSARRAARMALAFDDSLSEAHQALAFVHMLYEFDWKRAEAEFQRARRLDPTLSRSPLSGISIFYEWTGRFPEAVDEAARNVSTNPLSATTVVEYARALFFAGRLREAKAQLERARALDSIADRVNLTAGEIALKEGQHDQALREFERFAALTNQSSRALAFVGHASAVMGNRDRAQTILGELTKRRLAGKGTSFDLAIVYAGLGDHDAAFAWLNRAYEDRSIRPLIRDPTFARLHADPRFDVLLRRMKLLT